MNIYDAIDKCIDAKPKQTISTLIEYLTGDKYWTAKNISKHDIKALEELVNYINKGEIKLDSIKQQNSYIVYGSESCTNCKQAIQLLNQKEQQFVYKSFPEDYSLEELAELVGKPTRSVPQIFEVGEGNKLQHVGGLMELVKTLRNN